MLLLLLSDLVGEQRPDVVEQLQLLLQGVTALLRHVHDVQDGGSQVSQSRDGLHLDGVPVLQRVVQDTWGVHHLPAQVPVVHVTHKQRLGGEGVRLDVHVCSGHLM